jgi:radical SAM superfamily enzyme YgiQ (UPF0313 family)
VALSISFETDYLNVIALLELAGIEPWRVRRPADATLLVAGGPAVFLNPEPIADFFDLFLIGEAEEMLPEFVALLRQFHPRGAGARRCSMPRRGRWQGRTFRPISNRCTTGR